MRAVDEDPESVAGVDETLSRSGQPRARVGRRRKPERHARAELVRPRPRRPERTETTLVPAFEIGEIGRERLGSLHVHDRRHTTGLELVRAARSVEAQPAEDVELLVDDPCRLRPCDRLRRRERVRAHTLVRRRTARGEEREEAACEARLARRFQLEMDRSQAAPQPQQQIVVPVQDHGRITGAS